MAEYLKKREKADRISKTPDIYPRIYRFEDNRTSHLEQSGLIDEVHSSTLQMKKPTSFPECPNTKLSKDLTSHFSDDGYSLDPTKRPLSNHILGKPPYTSRKDLVIYVDGDYSSFINITGNKYYKELNYYSLSAKKWSIIYRLVSGIRIITHYGPLSDESSPAYE